MRNRLFALILFTATIYAKVNAQAGVYLFIPNITTGVGTTGHADEVLITSVQQGSELAIIYANSTGPSGNVTTTMLPGKVSVSDVVFTKGFDGSSLRLKNILFRATRTPFAEIRYYNGTGTGTLVYVVRVEEFFVNGYTSSNAECAAGCPGLSETISFAYSTIIFRNLVTTPNQILTYNKLTNATTFTQ